MVLASSDYPLLNAFWTMLIFFLWILWFFLLFRIIIDIFRSKDLGGGGKALWLIFVCILPVLGVFVYLIARGTGMTERDMQQYADQEAAFKSYVQQAAGSGGSAADELAKLGDLKAKGVISEDDYNKAKAKVLG